MKRIVTEHDEQKALIIWARGRAATVPEIGLLYAVPNGGRRNPVTAAKLREEGVLPGIPDLHLPVPRNSFASLYIELKRKGGRLQAVQLERIDELQAQNNRVCVCYGWIEAARAIETYLGCAKTV